MQHLKELILFEMQNHIYNQENLEVEYRRKEFI